MSVYCTRLMLEHPEQIRTELKKHGIGYAVIGSDSEERRLGSPYVYQGSHIVPTKKDKRGGRLEVGSIPNHCHPKARRDRKGDDMRFPVEFMGIGIDDSDGNQATVVLDQKQIKKLRDVLDSWLKTKERW